MNKITLNLLVKDLFDKSILVIVFEDNVEQKKKVIGFVLFPERGGLYPTFKLAKALSEKNHRVVYFGVADFEADVKIQGFEYIVLFEEEYGLGLFDPEPLHQNASFSEKMRYNTEYLNHFTIILRALHNGLLEKKMGGFGVDLLIIDSLLPYISIAAVRAGIKVLNVTTELLGKTFSLPPTTIAHVPKPDSFISSIRSHLYWMHLRWTYLRNFIFYHLCLLFIDLPRISRDDMKKLKQMTKESGLKFRFSEIGKVPLLPEIVLCDQIFDFNDHPTVKRRNFIGMNIYENRKEISFPWERLDSSKPVIYCSLGTHVAKYPYADRFFKAVAEASKLKPDWNFVVSFGPGRDPDQYAKNLSNFIGVRFVPQLQILKKASVMVTNGGLGTIKECISNHVPMFILPCLYDQPGNSARVNYHKIGVSFKISKISSIIFIKKVDELLKNPIYQVNIKKMNQERQEEFLFQRGIIFIESFLN